MSESSKNFSVRTIYRFVFFILSLMALLFTFLIISHTNGLIPSHKLLLKKHYSYEYLKDSEIEEYYHDFDHDGYSEKLQFKFLKWDKQIGVKFFTSQEKVVDQWNIPERWIFKAIYFADYNNDMHDEVYFFTKANDSLFLYAFDPRFRNQFLCYRQFITRAPRPNPHPQKIWDIYMPEAYFWDSNNDGFKECYILLHTGFSLQPRGIVRFDLKKKKITATSPPMTAQFGTAIFHDLNGDNKPEIIIKNCNAPGNSQPNIPFSDHNSYLLVFDLDLNFYFEPKIFPLFRSGVNNIVWPINGKNYIVTAYNYSGNLSINSKLLLYDEQGNLIRERIFPSGVHLTPFMLKNKAKPNKLVLLYKSKKQIDVLDVNFKTIKQISLPFLPISILKQIDLDGDLQDELLIIAMNRYVILEKDFKTYTVLPQPVPQLVTDVISFPKQGQQGSEIFIQQKDHFYLYSYQINPIFFWRYGLYGLLWLGIYFILLALFIVYQKVSANRQMHHHLFQFSNNGICLINPRGQLYFLNGNFERHLNLSRHITPNLSFEEALEEQPEVVRLIRALIKNRKFVEKEITFKKFNKNKSILFRGITLPGLFKIPAGFLIETFRLSSDTADRKYLEWSKTAKKMAHDIKSPLAAVQLATHTIHKKIENLLPEKKGSLEDDFKSLDEELDRIRQMTNYFLRYIDIEKLNYQWFSLKEICEHTIQKFQHFLNENLQIKLKLDEEHDVLWGDPGKISSVLQVIIENAIEAMEYQGQIIISSARTELPDEYFKSYIEITITDNGPGIPAEHLEHIFEPFYTTKPKGTGMGLTLTKKIIEEHNGKIEITSKPNFFTQVSIFLPFKEKNNGQ